LVELEATAGAGIVAVLDQLADADLLAGVEVLRQHLEQAGEVKIESLPFAHVVGPALTESRLARRASEGHSEPRLRVGLRTDCCFMSHAEAKRLEHEFSHQT